MLTETGKKRKILGANVQMLFRIIQSIPSPKAEPFKLWLAQVGDDRVQEIENPESSGSHVRFGNHFYDVRRARHNENSQKEQPDTFTKSKQVAQRGGNVAGVAREQAEKN